MKKTLRSILDKQEHGKIRKKKEPLPLSSWLLLTSSRSGTLNHCRWTNIFLSTCFLHCFRLQSEGDEPNKLLNNLQGSHLLCCVFSYRAITVVTHVPHRNKRKSWFTCGAWDLVLSSSDSWHCPSGKTILRSNVTFTRNLYKYLFPSLNITVPHKFISTILEFSFHTKLLSSNRSDEGLMLEMSALKLSTVADLRCQLS